MVSYSQSTLSLIRLASICCFVSPVEKSVEKIKLDFSIRIMYSLVKCSFAIGNHSVGI